MTSTDYCPLLATRRATSCRARGRFCLRGIGQGERTTKRRSFLHTGWVFWFVLQLTSALQPLHKVIYVHAVCIKTFLVPLRLCLRSQIQSCLFPQTLQREIGESAGRTEVEEAELMDAVIFSLFKGEIKPQGGVTVKHP